MDLESFVMLGTTVPEPDCKDPKKDQRVVVCSAGVSEYGLTRVYPLSWQNVPNRWKEYRVPVRRPKKDNRRESYEVAVDNGHNRGFNHVGYLNPRDRRALLEPHKVGSIREANQKRLSLAVLEPENVELKMHPTYTVESPRKWFHSNGRILKARDRFPWIPRLHFDDEAGPHKLALRDWGAFEWMRKHPEHTIEESQATLEGNLRLSERPCFLVGNYLNYRSTWLVISVLAGIRQTVDERELSEAGSPR